MGQREERQKGVVVTERRLHALDHPTHRRDQVAVGQHHAFRCARGPARVHDEGDVIGLGLLLFLDRVL